MSLQLQIYYALRAVVPRRKMQAAVRVFQRCMNLAKYGDYYFFREINIEINRQCNRRCYYCPQSVDPLKRQHIGDETFDLILSRLADINWTGPIGYAHYGEPLLDKRMVAFIRRTKAAIPKSKPRIFTNGDLLTAELRDKLIDAGLVGFAITRHDLEDRVWNRKIVPLTIGFEKYFTLEVIHGTPMSNRGGLVVDPRAKIQEMDRCDDPEASMHIGINGDVILCGCDYYGKWTYGNLAKYDIKTCWERYSRLRAELREGITRLPICQACFGRRVVTEEEGCALPWKDGIDMKIKA